MGHFVPLYKFHYCHQSNANMQKRNSPKLLPCHFPCTYFHYPMSPMHITSIISAPIYNSPYCVYRTGARVLRRMPPRQARPGTRPRRGPPPPPPGPAQNPSPAPGPARWWAWPRRGRRPRQGLPGTRWCWSTAACAATSSSTPSPRTACSRSSTSSETMVSCPGKL